MTIKILDCTFRDGGYYNNWDFDSDTVKKYLTSMSLSDVDIVEIGFRLLPKNMFYGAFAYSTDEYLSGLNIPDNIRLAVMINASEFISYPAGAEAAVDAFFKSAMRSPISVVRVVLRIPEIFTAKPIARRLKALGYHVCVNLMQIDAVDELEMIQAAKEITSWDAVDVLYFADSLGNLQPDSTRRIVKILRSYWPKELGFHAHDNKGQALVNSIAAAEAGATWLDGTILGMGRGAGNVSTESLMVEIVYRKWGAYKMNALYSLVMHDFTILKKRYNWGPNLFYHLAAVEGIHPTYIQELLSSDRYSLDQIVLAIKYLNNMESRSYSLQTLGIALRSSGGAGEKGTWLPSEWMPGREILIIGSGPSTKRHIAAIANYIQQKKPVVLCLNINSAVTPDIVSAYVACHESCILIESNQYHELGRPIILPLALVPEGVRPLLVDVEVFNYGLELSNNQIIVGDTGCSIPSILAFAYAISVAIASKATRILMAGFDGYATGDSRQDQMVEIIDLYRNMDNNIPVLSVTPTSYPILQRSIYEPNL